jgi:hypothetical protein
MERLSRSFLMLFLLVLMSFVIVPVEYIHALYDHEDTEDSFEYAHAATLENSHLHCLLLKTEFREFISDPQPQLNNERIVLCTVEPTYQNPVILFPFLSKEQRGPPV